MKNCKTMRYSLIWQKFFRRTKPQTVFLMFSLVCSPTVGFFSHRWRPPIGHRPAHQHPLPDKGRHVTRCATDFRHHATSLLHTVHIGTIISYYIIIMYHIYIYSKSLYHHYSCSFIFVRFIQFHSCHLLSFRFIPVGRTHSNEQERSQVSISWSSSSTSSSSSMTSISIALSFNEKHWLAHSGVRYSTVYRFLWHGHFRKDPKRRMRLNFFCLVATVMHHNIIYIIII